MILRFFAPAPLRDDALIFRPLRNCRRLLSSMAERLALIPDVDIDGDGKFKYIQIKAKDKASGQSKIVVRGYHRCPYHADILDEVKETAPAGFSFTCPGGGRIEHNAAKKTLLVYGYSQAYGQPDHNVAVELLKSKYPDYQVTASKEGY